MHRNHRRKDNVLRDMRKNRQIGKRWHELTKPWKAYYGQPNYHANQSEAHYWMNQQWRQRRRRDRLALKQERYEDIPWFENPVNWWNIY